MWHSSGQGWVAGAGKHVAWIPGCLRQAPYAVWVLPLGGKKRVEVGKSMDLIQSMDRLHTIHLACRAR